MRFAHEGHVVEWDGDFLFGGDPSGAVEVENAVPAQAVGAAFLSGCLSCYVVYVDELGDEQAFAVSGPAVSPVETFDTDARWALCGPGIRDGRVVADQCVKRRHPSMSVCPIVEELAAFGCLVGHLCVKGLAKPRMTRFCEPVGDLEGEESTPFNPDMEGDGFGRMAHLVQSGLPVVNQMMRTRSIPAFYGRVVSANKWWGSPIFLMRRMVAKSYFSTEKISLRNYAAAWVPVSVRNTKSFSKASGFGGEFVDIFVPSEMTPGLGSFLRFLESMGGLNFAVSSDAGSVPVPRKIPLFRRSEAYNVSKEKLEEVIF